MKKAEVGELKTSLREEPETWRILEGFPQRSKNVMGL
jgi:hypothetical protein